jgi:TonB family protein
LGKNMKKLWAATLLWPSMALAQGEAVSTLTPATPPPQAITSMRPHSCVHYYPAAVQKAHISGKTQVGFTIETDGSISNPTIMQSSGNADLDSAALSCVKTWRYKPALQNNNPVAVPWNATIEWDADAAPPPASCADFYSGPPVDLGKIDGTTEVKARVVRGALAQVSVETSSGNADLDFAALKCISAWPVQHASFVAIVKVRWGDLLPPEKRVDAK